MRLARLQLHLLVPYQAAAVQGAVAVYLRVKLNHLAARKSAGILHQNSCRYNIIFQNKLRLLVTKLRVRKAKPKRVQGLIF